MCELFQRTCQPVERVSCGGRGGTVEVSGRATHRHETGRYSYTVYLNMNLTTVHAAPPVPHARPPTPHGEFHERCGQNTDKTITSR